MTLLLLELWTLRPCWAHYYCQQQTPNPHQDALTDTSFLLDTRHFTSWHLQFCENSSGCLKLHFIPTDSINMRHASLYHSCINLSVKYIFVGDVWWTKLTSHNYLWFQICNIRLVFQGVYLYIIFISIAYVPSIYIYSFSKYLLSTPFLWYTMKNTKMGQSIGIRIVLDTVLHKHLLNQ